MLGVLLLGIAGVMVATDSAESASSMSSVGATVIAPVNVITSLAEVPVIVSKAGGWIQLVMPSIAPPPANGMVGSTTGDGASGAGVQGTSGSSNSSVNSGSAGSTAGVADGAGSRTAAASPDGTMGGAFATSLSAPTASGDGFRVTVAFN